MNDLFSEKKKQEIIEIIGDSLYEEVSKNIDLQSADIYQAAVDICTLLSGAAIFGNLTFQIWSLLHPKIVHEIKIRMRNNGINSVGEQVVVDIIQKVAQCLGFKYPPFDAEGNPL